MLYMYGASNPKYSDGANKKNKPMLMVISVDGKSSYYYYCPYTVALKKIMYIKQLKVVKNYLMVVHVICLQKKEVSNGKIL